MNNGPELKTKTSSFIRKIFKIVSSSKFRDIISWSEDGLSFIIKDEYNFTLSVIPKYFKHKNFSSFNRQLDMYDFHRASGEAYEFSHPLFKRNGLKLLKKIKLKSSEPSPRCLITEDLGSMLTKFQLKQSTMEGILQGLEHQYHKIVEQNQILISELMKSKQRSKRIQNYIKEIEIKAKIDEENESHPISDELLEDSS